MNGRVTIMVLDRQGGVGALMKTSMYVPVQSREMLRFLAKLTNKDILKGLDIDGMDAKCVANGRINTSRADPAKPLRLICTRRNLKIYTHTWKCVKCSD